jgi:hypothetical protein
MAHKRRHNQNNHRPPPVHQAPAFAVGDLVYFHAFAEQSIENSYFLCKGYIVRSPQPDSPVYKIVVVAVDPKSILLGTKPEIAKSLLGRRIAREQNQISYQPTDWMNKFYADADWLLLDNREVQKLKHSLQKKTSG